MPPAAESKGGSRALPRWLLILAAALLVARVAAGLEEQRNPLAPTELIQWQPAAVAEQRARAAGLPLLYEFSAASCDSCQRLQREVFADHRSAQTLNALFVPVRLVDTRRELGHNAPEVEALRSRFNVGYFPTLVVAPLDGSAPTVITGYPGKQSLMQQLTAAGVKARLNQGPLR